MTERVRLVGQRMLLVEEVKRKDRGMYQCLVSNLEGSAQGSAQLKLGGKCVFEGVWVCLRMFGCVWGRVFECVWGRVCV